MGLPWVWASRCGSAGGCGSASVSTRAWANGSAYVSAPRWPWDAALGWASANALGVRRRRGGRGVRRQRRRRRMGGRVRLREQRCGRAQHHRGGDEAGGVQAIGFHNDGGCPFTTFRFCSLRAGPGSFVCSRTSPPD